MFSPRRAIAYFGKIALGCSIILLLLLSISLPAAGLSYELGIRPRPQSLIDLGLPVVLAMIPSLVALWMVWGTAGRFVRSLYGLESTKDGRAFMGTRLLGQMSGGPYLIVEKAEVTRGSDSVRKIGGPGALVLYNDSAVVLERAGKLTKVFRGSTVPPFLLPPPKLEPFEKVWDVIDLRPQWWKFPVTAITKDGIPIVYDADIGFQIGDTDADIFKAATCKWIREADRTEPDRLMTWTKRVIIAETEGTLRSVLARYTLDQLIDPDCREAVRSELEEGLNKSAPGLGTKILRVALGDIRLEGQVLQQWFDTWRTEREREMEKTILAEGRVEGTKIAEKARAQVRSKMLAGAIGVFAAAAKRDRKAVRDFIILSFIEMIRRTSSEQDIYMPDDMVRTLDMLEARCKKGEPESEPPLLVEGTTQ